MRKRRKMIIPRIAIPQEIQKKGIQAKREMKNKKCGQLTMPASLCMFKCVQEGREDLTKTKPNTTRQQTKKKQTKI